DETLERVQHFELMKRGKRELDCLPQHTFGRIREPFAHVERNQSARIRVRRHRSSRPSMTRSDAPGTTSRSPKMARLRAFRSGHGAAGPLAAAGAKRATGLRRRVTSTVSPRSTRARTRLRFCWSSRMDTDAPAMYDILYD